MLKSLKITRMREKIVSVGKIVYFLSVECSVRKLEAE